MNLDVSNLEEYYQHNSTCSLYNYAIPVVENLATHDVSPDAPTVLIAFVTEPIVSQNLCIKVMRFKGWMMDMRLWALEKEEAVMVDKLLSASQTIEDNDIFSVRAVSQLAFSQFPLKYI